jgi:dimethylargininase
MDGGDVVVAGRTVYVGRSTRTNTEGIAWLRGLLARHGYTVTAVPVDACLHLKSACTYLSQGVVLANPDWVDVGVFQGLEILPVAPTEARAANAFQVGEAVVMAAGFPRTRAAIEARGFAVHAVDLSELQKAEAAGSCMSLVFEQRAMRGDEGR